MNNKKNVLFSNQDIFSLLCYLAIIDNELHDNELKYLKQVSKELNIDEKIFNKQINYLKKNFINDTDKIWENLDNILDKFETNKDKIYVLGILSDLAKKDLIIHQAEIKFLKYVSNKWGIKAVFTENIVWDNEQKNIIQAEPNKRIAVSAGPGTGKTAVACARVSFLLDNGLPASSILMLSFTRTAIKELTDRINSFVENENTATNLRITTIDSRAWSIRYGFTEEEVNKLFGDFDVNVEEAISKLNSNDQQFIDYLNSINHIIIDEAQDINGIRSDFINLLISKVNQNCGVTIFYDKAQAIYGFAEKKEGIVPKNFIEFVENYIDKKKFQKYELKNIKRTDSKKLQKLFTELRLGIFGYKNHTKKDIENTIKSITENSEFGKDLPSQFSDRGKSIISYLHKLNNNDLFLFRKKSEVLEASSIALSEKISHRLRIGGMPQNTLRSVIGLIFSDITEPILEINEFQDIVEEKYDEEKLVTEGSKEEFIDIVKLHFQKQNVILIKQMRKVLSRPSPPIEFTYIDYGHSGPVLGTIHASKGRESDNVLLTLPPITNDDDKSEKSNEEIEEEIKILYVGSTRPRHKLTTSFNHSNHYANTVKDINDRTFRNFKKFAVVEIGKQNDIDEFSVIQVNNFKKANHVNSLQKFLKEKFLESNPTEVKIKLDLNDYKYKVFINQKDLMGKNQDIYLCNMSNIFKKDIGLISKLKTGRGKFPNITAFITGTKTYVAKANEPRLSDCVHPYNISGIWLVPIIRGFSIASFKYA